MTDKRFEIGYDDGLLRFVKDNVTNTNLDIIDCWTILNELNDENEQLKKQLNYIQNLITKHIKQQKTTIGQKTLKQIIKEYNQYLLQPIKKS